MGRIGLCVFCLLKFSVAMCILLVKKQESMLFCVHYNDKEWKFKEQHAKMWENIARAKRYSRPRSFNIAGASAPVAPAVPTPLFRVLCGACAGSVNNVATSNIQ